MIRSYYENKLVGVDQVLIFEEVISQVLQKCLDKHVTTCSNVSKWKYFTGFSYFSYRRFFFSFSFLLLVKFAANDLGLLGSYELTVLEACFRFRYVI